jgi:uncharacterized SAM-binding protein YcdF (DUF218 family)
MTNPFRRLRFAVVSAAACAAAPLGAQVPRPAVAPSPAPPAAAPAAPAAVPALAATKYALPAAGRRYVVSRGVPDSAVLLESEGQSTSESLRAVAALLGELQRTAPAGSVAAAAPSAVFVSDPFHMLRIGVLARRYGIVAYTSPTPTSPISANPRLVLEYLARESLKVPFVLLTEHPADE